MKVFLYIYIISISFLTGVPIGMMIMTNIDETRTAKNLKNYEKVDCKTLYKAELFRAYNEVCNE